MASFLRAPADLLRGQCRPVRLAAGDVCVAGVPESTRLAWWGLRVPRRLLQAGLSSAVSGCRPRGPRRRTLCHPCLVPVPADFITGPLTSRPPTIPGACAWPLRTKKDLGVSPVLSGNVSPTCFSAVLATVAEGTS